MKIIEYIKKWWNIKSKKIKISISLATFFSFIYIGWYYPQRTLFLDAERVSVSLRTGAAYTNFYCGAHENTNDPAQKVAIWNKILETQNKRENFLYEVGVIANEIERIDLLASTIAYDKLQEFVDWNVSDVSYIITHQACPNSSKSIGELHSWQEDISSTFPLGLLDFGWFYFMPLWTSVAEGGWNPIMDWWYRGINHSALKNKVSTQTQKNNTKYNPGKVKS